MSSFNKTAAEIAALQAGTNYTLIAEIYKGHEQWSPQAMYSGEIPNIVFNAIAMSVFFVFFFWQLFFYIKFRNSTYGITTLLHLIGQAIGYLGRLLSVANISGLSLNNKNYFLLQFCCLTISPNFYNAAVYSEYRNIIYTYGTSKEKVSKLSVFGKSFQPLLLSSCFIISDITCLVIQGLGGGVEGTSVTSSNASGLKAGNNIFIAGLACQTFSMSFFAIVYLKLCYNIFIRQRLEFVQANNLHEKYNIPTSYSAGKSFFAPWRWYKIINSVPFENIDSKVINLDTSRFTSYQKKLFDTYPAAIFVAFGLAVIRCIYRLIELADNGFNGFLITHEHYLVSLDFVPLSLSGLIMCIYTQGLVYNKNGLKDLDSIRKASYRGLGTWAELAIELRYFFGLKVDEEKLDNDYKIKLFQEDESKFYVENSETVSLKDEITDNADNSKKLNFV
ncbi:hypothetical protein QEN19_002231 [Hanseniaspora menglaensis]